MLPVSCAGCGRWDVALCPDCRSLLTGEPIAVEHADAAGDLDVSALAVYAGPVRPMVLGWKNGAREDLAAFMTDVGARAGRRWARRLDEEVREAVDAASQARRTSRCTSFAAPYRRASAPVREPATVASMSAIRSRSCEASRSSLLTALAE